MVSAGASGIGLEIARSFAREGANVHVCDVDREAVARLAKSDPALGATVCDVSDREQRKGFYRALFVVLPAGSVALWVLQPALRRGIVTSWALILASMAANRFVKSSLHVAFAAFCAASVPMPPVGAVAAGIAVVAIAWSRLALRRHTLAEVALGALLGAVAGLSMRF